MSDKSKNKTKIKTVKIKTNDFGLKKVKKRCCEELATKRLSIKSGRARGEKRNETLVMGYNTANC